MQAPRRHLEILPPKQMLLPSRRNAHICQRAGVFRHNNVLPSAKDHLGLTDQLAKEDWGLHSLRCGYIVRITSNAVQVLNNLLADNSASIAACFRLARTVAFARTSDRMYLLGPLLFWACAEMTCGFCIFCLPCLSKLVMESGLPRRVKSGLGFSPKSSQPSQGSDPPHISPRPGRFHPSKHPLDSDASWSRIEDGDMDLEASGRL
ncbi:hypothetical protein N7466_000323 [Penicillium verhagenii]|uniref:uncharacterized protein n=1 Tax=Penicillium verhagenii TaxID=1562060 RepID=UPI0025450D70|nr:uncharacterized protein N7466_000323 [Penicillium verhagenii]KAJ5947308.1 hypothetical protein N7466_000323 [Penicillium verhagenii]